MMGLKHLCSLSPWLPWGLVGGKSRLSSADLLPYQKTGGQVNKISLVSLCIYLVSCSYPSYAEPPPNFKPYTLPTFTGIEPAINTHIEPYIKAPIINANSIFQTVLRCYPHKSKWKIDVELRGSIANNRVFSDAGTNLGKNYVQIVASMPLYSSKEMDRAIKNEHDLRQETAKMVSSFIKSIGDRNHAMRKIALYTSLERRSSIRVKSGVTAAKEQVSYLEKVAKSHESKIKAESDIMTARLALSAMCSGDKYKRIDTYLSKLGGEPQ